ncbi:hypothetical protein F5Y14DRAFT_445648 [Nemania sp. NC0429]|nr:hypothetical protein F5Y14DRAFT_445648 [Nemania sp. NC0429]
MDSVSDPIEPIAIVGSSCRFSGDVATPSQLWDLLSKPHDLSREVPSDRFNVENFYNKDGRHHGTTNCTKAYWLNDDPLRFDAGFFRIKPKEAEALDPQQRLLLEVVFEAMEAGGFPIDQYSGKEVGVFSGCMTQDYEALSVRDELAISEYFVIGNSRAIMSNRLSHFFDFRGPSMSIDTACSSSLVALQLAVQSLRSGNCTMACVTGANLMLAPDQFIVESSLGMLSPSGKCHMWDDRADGYARGEGIAAVILKPLAQAIVDGDHIEGVIREVCVNADGKTSQLTEPNPVAQAALIRKTYQRAGLDPTRPSDRCQYFEAHGTGTRAGDPREAKAIHDAFFSQADASQDNTQPVSPSTEKLIVGSVKTVIGHTEAASGLAGLLKTIWSLKHGLIPPNLHFENLNPDVEPSYTHLQVPTVLTPWPAVPAGEPRRASVNSFGFGGTNSHAIIESYTPEVHGGVSVTRSRSHSKQQAPVKPDAIPFYLPIVISAASSKSVQASKIDIRELSWHQYSHRSDLAYRARPPIPVEKGNRSNAKGSPGAQWPTMSKSLLYQSGVYRCRRRCSWTLEGQIMAGENASRIHEAAIALVDFLRSVGVDFHTVIGHSSGEIAAAYAAGKLSAEDAIVISYYRGMVAHLASSPRGQPGGMVATSNPLLEDSIQLAATNSPNSTTLSGDLCALIEALKEEEGKLADSKMLRVDTAYHSRHMTMPAVNYVKAMRHYGVSPISGGNQTIWVSSVKDRPRTGAQDLDCQYWADNMVNQVEFCEAVEYALSQYGDEIDCAGPFRQTAESLGRKIPGLSVSDFLGWMCYIERSPMPDLLQSRLSDLPLYPFDHSVSYSRDTRISHLHNFREEGPHELLGLKWRNLLTLDSIPWLEHHRFQDQALLPASAYCVMALDAARSFLGDRPASLIELLDFKILSAIPIDAEGPGVETYFSLCVSPNGADGPVIDATFALYSRPARHDGGTELKMNASGSLHIVLGTPSMDVLPHRCTSLCETSSADPNAFYDMMKTAGLTYTGPFRALTSIQRRYHHCEASLSRFHHEDSTNLEISPATLDACFQSAFLSYASPGDGSLWTSFLPTSIDKIQFNLAALGAKTAGDREAVLTADTYLADCTPPTETSTATIAVDIGIFNAAGEPEIQVEGLLVRALADNKPSDDVEMYLHTVMDVDPSDEIVCSDNTVADGDDVLLAENCRRVASYCLDEYLIPGVHFTDDIQLTTAQSHHDASNQSSAESEGQSSETHESIHAMIRSSAHADYLKFIEKAGKRDPIRLHEMLPFIEEEARQVSIFRRHIGRIAKQITHRHPYMNIMHFVTNQTDLTGPILTAVGDSFQSFIIGRSPEFVSSARKDEKLQSVEGVRYEDIDLREDLEGQIGSNTTLDLVILPTALLSNDDANSVLTNIGKVMKSGGFLVLVDSHTTVLGAQPRNSSGHALNHPLTPPHWHDALDTCGFSRQARSSVQSHPAGSVFVRQFQEAGIVPQPKRDEFVANKFLFIQGASKKKNGKLASSLRDLLSRYCRSTTTRSLDEVTAQDAQDCTAAIVLADLDEPLMSNMTEHRICRLRDLFQPGLTILWVTRNSQSSNPEHAASFGFLRTIAAEVPAPKLQILDLDTNAGESPGATIAAAFVRLLLTDKDTTGQSLWTFEPEIHMENGRRLIPRVVPWKPGNDRANALYRAVTRPVNTLRQRVEVVPELNPSGSLRFQLKDTEQDIHEPSPGSVVIQVDCSSALPIKLGSDISSYVCVGRKWKTGERMVALSGTNSSYITCPHSQISALQEDAPPSLEVLYQTICYIAALTSVSMAANGERIFLIDPNVEFAKFVVDVTTSTPSARQEVVILETYSGAEDTSRFSHKIEGEGVRYTLLRLHKRAPAREVKQAFSGGGVVFNFLPEDHELSQAIAKLAPSSCTVYPGSVLLNLESHTRKEDNSAMISMWLRAVTVATRKSSADSQELASPTAISLGKLRTQQGDMQPFQIIDWQGDRDVLESVSHTTAEQLLFPDKTYILFGMTGDFGHSMCRLFLSRGARNIVLVSRNASKSQHWVAELNEAYGADIRIERGDVTDIKSLRALKQTISETMPPVGGVVNGAMVLEDCTFAQMTLDTWNRVLHPKTIGSKNLDTVFDERNLDFFIMTSSFAAVGGHPGQSNYAAANMYMNGLAADRRRRGLVGSALNIGVIYGLGFLHREKDYLYAGLEREGYPPISEHNLHHMFLEAIVAGRPLGADGLPHHGRPFDITTGLRRFQRGIPDPLHWHLDPRFGHFAARHGADGEDTVATARKSLQEGLVVLKKTEDVAEVIGAALVGRLQTLLGLPEGAIDQQSSMTDLGLDSLAAGEIRNWFMKNVGNQIAVVKVLDAPSIRTLCEESAVQYLAARGTTKDASAAKN